MDNELIRTGIKILMPLFFNAQKKDEWLAMSSLELQYELGVFNDPERVSSIIKEENAYALLEKLELYDVKLVSDIKKHI